MIIRVVVDQNLHDLSAIIRRETLERILVVVGPHSEKAKDWSLVGEIAGAQYSLVATDSTEREAGVLYVSPGVKQRFYADQATLELPAQTQ